MRGYGVEAIDALHYLIQRYLLEQRHTKHFVRTYCSLHFSHSHCLLLFHLKYGPIDNTIALQSIHTSTIYQIMKSSILVAAATTTSCAHAFVPAASSSRTAVSLNMGLFDGVKEAFGADGMGDLDSERETPIDRWMGWNTKSNDAPTEAVGSKGTCFIPEIRKRIFSTCGLT